MPQVLLLLLLLLLVVLELELELVQDQAHEMKLTEVWAHVSMMLLGRHSARCMPSLRTATLPFLCLFLKAMPVLISPPYQCVVCPVS